MKVRIKDKYYIYDRLYKDGEICVLRDYEGHKRIRDGVVEPVVIKADDQFSERFMEKLDGEAEVAKPKKAAKKVSKKKEEPEVVEDDFSDEDVI